MIDRAGLKLSDDFSTTPGSEGAEDGLADIFADEDDMPVGHHEMGSAGVGTAEVFAVYVTVTMPIIWIFQ